jgi:hypothetical protein
MDPNVIEKILKVVSRMGHYTTPDVGLDFKKLDAASARLSVLMVKMISVFLAKRIQLEEVLGLPFSALLANNMMLDFAILRAMLNLLELDLYVGEHALVGMKNVVLSVLKEKHALEKLKKPLTV